MILIIDNYDSFTFNLVQLLGGMDEDITVLRNDERTVDEVAAMGPGRILLSPGPGRPEGAGITLDVIRRFSGTIPILGVCLGHQAIGLAFGGRVVHAPTLMHGRTSEVHHEGDPLFAGVSSPFTATRYHSLVISPESVPGVLRVTATTADGVIMAVRHREHPTVGVQFHPESILTVEGKVMISNWLGETL